MALLAGVVLAGCREPSGSQQADARASGSVVLSISCGAVGQEFERCREGVEAWSKRSGHQVKLVALPHSSSEMLALFQQHLAARSPELDVLQVDVIWPGILGDHFIDLTPYAQGVEKEHLPRLIENNTRAGRLVAMPWFTDAGVLYYRRDLLEAYGVAVPQTWRELTDTSARIMAGERAKGNAGMWGFVFQGKLYEGLTCNALEWVASHGGGSILDARAAVTIDNPSAAAALELASSWIRSISPEGVLNYAEEEARGVFQSGQAVFMRNWPYAWALMESPTSPVKGRVGVAALPRGGASGSSAAVLGGWQLAVSRYSRHPELAADLVLYLTGVAEQKRRAIEGGHHPTIAALYDDPEVLAAHPFFASLSNALSSAVVRPSAVAGPKYNRLSLEFSSAVHEILSGREETRASLAALKTRLLRLEIAPTPTP